MAALSPLYAAAVFRNDPHLLSLQYKLKMTSLSTDWIENEHFRLVSMKMSVFKSKTGSLNSGTVLKDPDVEPDSVGSVEPDSVPGSESRKANNASEKKLRKKVYLLKSACSL